MKKLSIIITIVALMLNVMSVRVAHACPQDNGTQSVKAVDDPSPDKNAAGEAHCTQCSFHHNCSTTLSVTTGSSEFFSASKETYSWDNTVKYSQLNFPPSKPPKA